MALWLYVIGALVHASVLILIGILEVRIVVRERRKVSGMLAACREHRHDCKRFAEQAQKARGGPHVVPFVRDL